MGIADVRKIDGSIKYFDERGNECDNLGRPYLRQDPETKAKRERLRLEAIENTKRHNVVCREKREDEKSKAELNERIASLREAIFHLKCQQEFYHNLNKPDVLSLWLDDIDKNISELHRYRNNLLKKHCIADEMIGELASVMLHHDHEITSLQDEIEKIESKHKEPRVKAETDTLARKKAKLAETLGAEKVAQLAAMGVTLDQMVAGL